jgi:hypothetical protein
MTNTQLLIQALTTVYNIFGWREPRPAVQAAIEASGINAALVMFRCSPWEIAYIEEVRRAFGLSATVTLRLSTRDSFGGREGVTAEISWPSGGGSPGAALAQLSLQMELTQKIAQAEMVLSEALRRFKTKEDLKAALVEVESESNAALEKVRALLPKD